MKVLSIFLVVVVLAEAQDPNESLVRTDLRPDGVPVVLMAPGALEAEMVSDPLICI